MDEQPRPPSDERKKAKGGSEWDEVLDAISLANYLSP
jgi:hypothetical protein